MPAEIAEPTTFLTFLVVTDLWTAGHQNQPHFWHEIRYFRWLAMLTVSFEEVAKLHCHVMYCMYIVHTTTISVSVPNRRAAVLTFIRIFSEVIKSLNLGDPSNRPLFPPNITSEGREAVEAPSEHLIIFSLGKESMARRTKKKFILPIFENFI